MKVEIVITGNKDLHTGDSFGESIVNLINNDSNLKRITIENPKDIATLIKHQLSGGIETILPNHLNLEEDFALRLNILESMDCSCLKPTSSLGSVLRDIMIDNYQLILTRKHWRDTDKIDLFFDAVDYGDVDDFIASFLRGKKNNITFSLK